MNVVIASPLYPPEIAEPAPYTKQVSEHLCAHHQVTVVVYGKKDETKKCPSVVAVNKHRPLLLRLFEYTIHLWKASSGAQVIYAESLVASGLPAAIVSRLRHCGLILHVREDEVWERATRTGKTKQSRQEFLSRPVKEWRLRMIQNLQRRILRKADTCVFSSQALADLFKEVYQLPESSVEVSPQPHEERVVLPFPSVVRPYQLCTIGRLVSWKDDTTVLHAVRELKNEFPEIHLLMIGEGPEEQSLRKLVDELQLQSNVTFLGAASHAESWYTRTCSVAVLANMKSEDLQGQIVQGLATGTPVIQTPSQSAELAQQIRSIFTSPEVVERLKKEGEEQRIQKYSWEAHIQRLEKIFSSFTKRSKNV